MMVQKTIKSRSSRRRCNKSLPHNWNSFVLLYCDQDWWARSGFFGSGPAAPQLCRKLEEAEMSSSSPSLWSHPLFMPPHFPPPPAPPPSPRTREEFHDLLRVLFCGNLADANMLHLDDSREAACPSLRLFCLDLYIVTLLILLPTMKKCLRTW